MVEKLVFISCYTLRSAAFKTVFFFFFVPLKLSWSRNYDNLLSVLPLDCFVGISGP